MHVLLQRHAPLPPGGPTHAMAQPKGTVGWRWQLVIEYQQRGSYSAVAKQFDTSRNVVRKWVNRNKATGDVQDLPRVGRPKKGLSSPAAHTLLKRGVRSGLACTEIGRLLKNELELDVSVETIRTHLKAHLARPMRPKKVPLMTEAQRAKRVAFSKKWLPRDWSNVVISDSKVFWLCPKGVGSKQWVLYEDEPPVIPTPKNQTKVHVYGAVSKWGKTPLFPTAGTSGMKFPSKGVTASIYVKLLQDNLMPAMREMMQRRSPKYKGQAWIFQQDGAPAHTAATTKAWLAAQAGVELMEWPPSSPDLSWIENLWGIVSNKLRKRTDLTPQNFKETVLQEWESIPLSTCVSLHGSIKRRLQACIDGNGAPTKY